MLGILTLLIDLVIGLLAAGQGASSDVAAHTRKGRPVRSHYRHHR